MKKDIVLHIRVLATDNYEAWKAAAKKDERSLIGWIRKVCNDAVRKVKPSDKL